MTDYDRDKKALDASAKRDADAFADRQKEQEERRKREHARTVQSKITTLERDLSHKHSELGAIKLELPRLRDRIDKAHKTTRSTSVTSSDRTEERTIEEITRKLAGLKQNEEESKRHLEEHGREMEELKRTNSETSEEIRELHSKLSSKEEALRILQQEIQTIERTIEQAESKKNSANSTDGESLSLKAKLTDIQNIERRTEDELSRHKNLLADAKHTTEKEGRAAEDDGRVAQTRLREQERKAGTLEQEVRRIESEITELKRELA